MFAYIVIVSTSICYIYLTSIMMKSKNEGVKFFVQKFDGCV